MSAAFEPVEAAADTGVVDCNGNAMSHGDTVAVIKDLKVKGSSVVIKVATRVKNIRLAEGDHDIDCRMPVQCS